MCREKHRKSSSWLGNSVRWFVVHEHVNIHILLSLFVGLCTHSNVRKVSSANRGEGVTTSGLYRPTHLCEHTSNCTKKCQFFLWCGKVGVCLGEGVMVHVSGGRGLCVVSERGGWFFLVQGSNSQREKAVEQSGGAGSILHDTGSFTGALCSLSAGGSCGLLHYSSRTRQWCSWSEHSQWFPCRK